MVARLVRLAKIALIGCALAAPFTARAADPVYQGWRGIAIPGTDPLACLQADRPAGRER